ncbi:MAG: DUF2326 domain-containing protein [Deltaproteobacteria bacterium]|jgi:uncharacterized protein YydD (DUF2326 family)|nr:DUF2326 domain-containing protein [Deltaproteobacteria bacterium]
MIHHLKSDLGHFKSLTFNPGLNIILADKSEGATNRRSRNDAGQTSFIELIHFLFGADIGNNSIFKSAALAESTFEIAIDIGGQTVVASRSANLANKISLKGQGIENWPLSSSRDRDSELLTMSNVNWKANLGDWWFDIPIASDDGSEGYNPSFRSLFSYFARRRNRGGRQSPFQHAEKQRFWDWQVSISHLLGLDYNISKKLEELRTMERNSRELSKAAKSGDLGSFFGQAADLRTELVIAEAKAESLSDKLRSFEIVPEYQELEEEANKISRDIDELNTDNLFDGDLLKQLNSSIVEEDPTDVEYLLKLYNEAGIVFSDSIKRRFEEVGAFNQAVISNRKAHLSGEIQAAKARMTQRDLKIEEFDQRRRRIMSILNSGGALNHYTSLREEVGRLEAKAEVLRQRLKTAERIERTKAELKIKRANLFKELQDDIHDRSDTINEAILSFASLSGALYEKAGSLTISATKNGPRFDIQINSQRSQGLSNMRIFCFDLTLMEICLKNQRGPGFLIHDGHLFEGVDERLVAKALELGSKRANSLGFQYIVTMNSDALPREGFSPTFDLNSFINDLRLTDATETGGLFGLHFD